MADRYWVGGTGTWNTTNSTNWAASNGGSGGNSVPTAADNVFFTSLSGGGTCTNSGTNPCLSLNMTGYTGTFAGTGTINISGNLTLSASGSLTYTGSFAMAGSAVTSTVNSNGKTIPGNLNSNKTNNTVQLISAVTVSGQTNINSAGFDLNGFTLTTAFFNYTGNNLAWGSTPGKIVCSRSTAGIALSTNGTNIATGGRIEVLSPPTGVTITVQGNISLTAVSSLPDVYFINSGTGTIDSVGVFYRTLEVGAGSYGVSGSPYIARLMTVSASHTGTNSMGVFLTPIDTLGIDFNPNGKTFTGQIQSRPSPLTANGACPVRVNQSATFTDTNGFQWFGGSFSIENNSTLTVHNVRLDPRPTANNSSLNFPGTSKIVCTATSGIAIRAVSNYYTRTAGITNNNPIEVTAPASGNEIQLEIAQNEDTTTGRTKCIGVRILAGGTGTVRLQQPDISNTLPIMLKDFYCANSGYTLTQTRVDVVQIARNHSAGPLIGNLITAFYYMSNSAVVQEVNLNGAGGFGMYFDNNVNGPVRLLSNAGSTGQGTYLANQISNIYFGNAGSGSGRGYVELQSFRIMSRGNIQASSTFTDTVNINFGTGAIRFYSEAVGTVTFALYSSGLTGTISGSKNIEISAYSTLANAYNRELNSSQIYAAGKELNIRVLNTGDTGQVQASLIQGTLTLENGPYTYGFTSGSTELYGNITLLGTVLFNSSFFFNAPASAVTSTITSNGFTMATRFNLNGAGHTMVLADALICRTIDLTNGTLNLNNFNATINTSFSGSGSSARTIAFGTGSITLAQNSTFTTSNSTSLTLTGASRQIFATVGAAGCTITTASSPTESVAFDVTTLVVGSGGTVSAGGSARNLTLNSGTYTFTRDASYTIFGDLTVNNGPSTYSGGGTSLSFSKSSGTQIINTGGSTFGGTGGISFNRASTTLRLDGNSNFAAGFTLTAGTLSLNGFRLTLPSFASSNSNTRTIDFNSGAIRLTGSGTVWDTSTTTNLTVSGTNRFVEPNLNGNQTLSFGAPTLANAFDISVPTTASNFTLTIGSGSNNVRNLIFSNVAYTVANTQVNVLGDMTILGTTPTFTSGTQLWNFGGTSGTQTITTNGKVLDFPIVKGGANTLQLGSDLTLTNRTFTLSAGTLDLQTRVLTVNIFDTDNTVTRSVVFGTGSKITVTNNAGSTAFAFSQITGMTVTGTNRTIESRPIGGSQLLNFGTPTSDAQQFDWAVSASATGTSTPSGYIRNATFENAAYTASFSNALRFYGNFTCQGTSPTFSGAGTQTFVARGTQTITSSGETFSFPITIGLSGETGTVQLADALNIGANTLTHTLATFNAAGYNVTAGSYVSNNSNTRALTMGNGTWTLSGSGTPWDITTTTGMTLTRGTGSMIFTSASTKTLQCGGLTYPTITQGGSGTMIIAGTNSRFANLTRTHNAAVTIQFTSGQTFLFDDFTLTGVSAAARTTLSSTSTSQHTLSKSSGIVSSDFLAISYSNATGGAGWYAGTGSTQGTSVSGWIFTAPPSNSGNMFMMFR